MHVMRALISVHCLQIHHVLQHLKRRRNPIAAIQSRAGARQTLRLRRSTTSTCDNVHHHKWTLSPTIQLRQGGQAGRLQRERGLQRCFAPTPELTMPTGLVTTPEARRVHRVAGLLTWH